MQQASRPGWACRYGYVRSMECRQAGESGQDYLALDIGDQGLSFVLCDGISQSYYGELAARMVGDRLLDWLAEAGEAARDEPEALRRHWDACSRELAASASQTIREHEISTDIQGMLREVLLDKKRLGSATVYCGGRIDFPCDAFPGGRLLLVWQGDIRCRIWNGTSEVTWSRLGNRFHTREQWNSIAGPTGGIPHLFMDRLLHGARRGELLIYTDGLKVLDSHNPVTGQALAQAVASASGQPASDDISYLQVQWDYKL